MPARANVLPLSQTHAAVVCRPVGAGKSVFARAFIRAVMADEALVVASPSFLLDNHYTTEDGRHM